MDIDIDGPSCFPGCAADQNSDPAILDFACQMEATVDADSFEIPECVADGMGEPTPPADATSCFVYLTDSFGYTPLPDDDMSTEYVDMGVNLEFRLVHTAMLPSEAVVRASCELSDDPARDCPNL